MELVAVDKFKRLTVGIAAGLGVPAVLWLLSPMAGMLSTPLLSTIIFLPLVGALVVLMLPPGRADIVRMVSLVFSLLVLGLAFFMLRGFDPSGTGFQFEEHREWIRNLGIAYHVGVDGLSLLLSVLTALLTPVAILCSWDDHSDRAKEFFSMLLFLETGMLGTFFALDTFLFYVFWELMLVPMYVIIGAFGGPRRIYAAVKFVIYTMVGSLLMLLALFYLYHLHREGFGYSSADISDLYRLSLSFKEQVFLFSCFALAFAIKVPMVPFHTWLPDAHVEAPTAGSVILAGVLLKMGSYGFLRFALPMFPSAAVYFGPYLAAMAVVGVIYGALLAWAQGDMKKLVAYSSVSHMGFVMLGMFALTPVGIQGSIYQMLNHGISTGALFLLVGLLYHRRHTRRIDDFGGLASSIPVYSVVFMLVALSSIGLPGLNGFVGEFLILLGTFTSGGGLFGWPKLAAVGAAVGIILGAVYMLGMVQRVFFGKTSAPENKNIDDIKPLEIAYMAPLLLLIVWMGIYPKPFLKRIESFSKNYAAVLNAKISVPNVHIGTDKLEGIK